VHALTDVLSALAGRLGSVDAKLLLVAVVCHVANLLLRAGAWHAVLRAAHPGVRVRRRAVTGAYLAGVGVNSLAPARAGDVVKVGLAHRSIAGSTCTTVAATLVAEGALDVVVGISLVLWALHTGAVPSGIDPFSRLPYHPGAAETAVLAAAVALIVAAIAARVGSARLRSFARRVRHGLAIFRRPGLYLRAVALPQLVGWGFRAASVACFLGAFGIAAGGSQVALVLAAGSLAALVPAAPGGAGAQQALVIVLLRSMAAGATVLSFSLGMQLAVTLVNVVLGIAAVAVTLRCMPWSVRLAMAEPEPATVSVTNEG
jgi:glycosyltransferase 2 family protein